MTEYNKYIIFTLFDIFKNMKIKYFYNNFKKTLKLSYSENKKIQFFKLKKLINYAYFNVPFYRKRFDESNFNPTNLNSFDDIRKIPFLTRRDLQENWEKLFAIGYNEKNCKRGSSGGSTGEPVIYFKDKFAESAGIAAGFVGWEISGWRFGDKGLHIWGNPSIVKEQWSTLGSKIKTIFFNHYKFPAYRLTELNKFEEIVQMIKENNFDFIDGYTNAIYLLAKFIEKNNIEIPRFKYILTTAEKLHNFQRETINNFLGPVFDGYGCSEINGIAYECNICKKYHIISPHVYVEVDEDNIFDGVMPIVVTDLDNYSFPLIRYKNGDLGLIETKKSNCKIPYDSLSLIEGRVSDIIKLPNGGTLSVPSFFGSMLLKKVNGLIQYQIIRRANNYIEIKIVTDERFKVKDRLYLEEALKEYLSEVMDWKIRIVDKIEPSPNGKFKLIIDESKNNT